MARVVTAAQPVMVAKVNKAAPACRMVVRVGLRFRLLLVAMAVTAVMAA